MSQGRVAAALVLVTALAAACAPEADSVSAGIERLPTLAPTPESLEADLADDLIYQAQWNVAMDLSQIEEMGSEQITRVGELVSGWIVSGSLVIHFTQPSLSQPALASDQLSLELFGDCMLVNGEDEVGLYVAVNTDTYAYYPDSLQPEETLAYLYRCGLYKYFLGVEGAKMMAVNGDVSLRQALLNPGVGRRAQAQSWYRTLVDVIEPTQVEGTNFGQGDVSRLWSLYQEFGEDVDGFIAAYVNGE